MTTPAATRPLRPRRFAGCAGRSVLAVAALILVLGCPAGAADAQEDSPAGAPVRGGTLKLLGTSDVFNLDTVSGYSTLNNLIGRAFTRQLLTYESVPR